MAFETMAQNSARIWTHLFCAHFCVCGWQDPNATNLSSVGEDTITQGDI